MLSSPGWLPRLGPSPEPDVGISAARLFRGCVSATSLLNVHCSLRPAWSPSHPRSYIPQMSGRISGQFPPGVRRRVQGAI